MLENIKSSLVEKVSKGVSHVKKNSSIYLTISAITATSLLAGCNAGVGFYLPPPDYDPVPFIFVPPGYCSIHHSFGCCR